MNNPVNSPVKNWEVFQACPECEAAEGQPCQSRRKGGDPFCAYQHHSRLRKPEFQNYRGRPRKDMDPIGLKILETLTEEWVPYEELIAKMSPLVPPGVAWRTAENARKRHFTRLGQEVKPRRNNDQNAIILSGARTYIRKIIGNLNPTHRSGRDSRIEIQYEMKEVYKKPVAIRLSESEVELRKIHKWEDS